MLLIIVFENIKNNILVFFENGYYFFNLVFFETERENQIYFLYFICYLCTSERKLILKI